MSRARARTVAVGPGPRVIAGFQLCWKAAIVTGKINVLLHADRFMPGRLRYYSAGQQLIFACDCLARSAGILDKLTGAVRRDPLQYRGDTPTGIYALTFISRLARPPRGIGGLWIGLDPVSGQALRAEQLGRKGLGIHAGRGNGALRPTHGCIRLRDADMQALADAVGKRRFTVEVDQI